MSGSQAHLPVGQAKEDSFEIFVVDPKLGQRDTTVESQPIEQGGSVDCAGDVCRSLLNCHCVAAALEGCHQAGEVAGVLRRYDRLVGGFSEERSKIALEDEPALVDDDHLIGHCLDLGEEVARYEDGLPLLSQILEKGSDLDDARLIYV